MYALHHFMDEVGWYKKRIYKAAIALNEASLKSKDKEKVVQDFLEANPLKKEPDKDFRAAVVSMRIDCLRIAALLKHSAFQEENEWRLVLPVMLERPTPMSNPPQFRIGKARVCHPAQTVSGTQRLRR
jgi:hypothetical protein